MRGGFSRVQGPRYFKLHVKRILTHDDVNNLFGLSMTQALAYAEIDFDENTCLETILATPDDADIGYIVEGYLKYPNRKKQKTE